MLYNIFNSNTILMLMGLLSNKEYFIRFIKKIYPKNDSFSIHYCKYIVSVFFIYTDDIKDILFESTDEDYIINEIKNKINRDTKIWKMYFIDEIDILDRAKMTTIKHEIIGDDTSFEIIDIDNDNDINDAINTDNNKKNVILSYSAIYTIMKKMKIHGISIFGVSPIDSDKFKLLIIRLIQKLKHILKLYQDFNGHIVTLRNIYNDLINRNKKIYSYLKIRKDDNTSNPRFIISIDDINKYLHLSYYNFDEILDNIPQGEKIKYIVENFNYTAEKYHYGKYDNIFDYAKNNVEISNELINTVINKINKNEDICIIGYGQSGVGKTSSFIKYNNNNGIIIELINNRMFTDLISKISLNIYNIYINHKNKDFYDGSDKSLLGYIQTNKHEDDYIITKHQCSKDCFFEFKKGSWSATSNNNIVNLSNFLDMLKIRNTEPTILNPDSSRSHLIIEMTCTLKTYTEDEEKEEEKKDEEEEEEEADYRFYQFENHDKLFKPVDSSKKNTADEKTIKLVICDLAGFENKIDCSSTSIIEKISENYTKSQTYGQVNNEKLKSFDFDNYYFNEINNTNSANITAEILKKYKKFEQRFKYENCDDDGISYIRIKMIYLYNLIIENPISFLLKDRTIITNITKPFNNYKDIKYKKECVDIYDYDKFLNICNSIPIPTYLSLVRQYILPHIKKYLTLNIINNKDEIKNIKKSIALIFKEIMTDVIKELSLLINISICLNHKSCGNFDSKDMDNENNTNFDYETFIDVVNILFPKEELINNIEEYSEWMKLIKANIPNTGNTNILNSPFVDKQVESTDAKIKRTNMFSNIIKLVNVGVFNSYLVSHNQLAANLLYEFTALKNTIYDREVNGVFIVMGLLIFIIDKKDILDSYFNTFIILLNMLDMLECTIYRNTATTANCILRNNENPNFDLIELSNDIKYISKYNMTYSNKSDFTKSIFTKHTSKISNDLDENYLLGSKSEYKLNTALSKAKHEFINKTKDEYNLSTPSKNQLPTKPSSKIEDKSVTKKPDSMFNSFPCKTKFYIDDTDINPNKDLTVPIYYSKNILPYAKNNNLFLDNYEVFYNFQKIVSNDSTITKIPKHFGIILSSIKNYIDIDIYNCNYLFFSFVDFSDGTSKNNPPTPPYICIDMLKLLLLVYMTNTTKFFKNAQEFIIILLLYLKNTYCKVLRYKYYKEDIHKLFNENISNIQNKELSELISITKQFINIIEIGNVSSVVGILEYADKLNSISDNTLSPTSTLEYPNIFANPYKHKFSETIEKFEPNQALDFYNNKFNLYRAGTHYVLNEFKIRSLFGKVKKDEADAKAKLHNMVEYDKKTPEELKKSFYGINKGNNKTKINGFTLFEIQTLEDDIESKYYTNGKKSIVDKYRKLQSDNLHEENYKIDENGYNILERLDQEFNTMVEKLNASTLLANEQVPTKKVYVPYSGKTIPSKKKPPNWNTIVKTSIFRINSDLMRHTNPLYEDTTKDDYVSLYPNQKELLDIINARNVSEYTTYIRKKERDALHERMAARKQAKMKGTGKGTDKETGKGTGKGTDTRQIRYNTNVESHEFAREQVSRRY